MYFNYTYGLRKHCGGLDESLKTIKLISKLEFESLKADYEFYCIDNRCNQVLFISKNPIFAEYTWLFIGF